MILQRLGVMDQTAITLCEENKLPLIVLNIQQAGRGRRSRSAANASGHSFDEHDTRRS